MPKLTEYPEAQSFDENDILIKDGVNGTKKIKASNAADYMGKNVIMVNEDPTPGTKVVLETTDEEYELALMSDVNSVAEEVDDVKTQLNTKADKYATDPVTEVSGSEYINDFFKIANAESGKPIIVGTENAVEIIHTQKNLFKLFDRTSGTLSRWANTWPRDFKSTEYYLGMNCVGQYNGPTACALNYTEYGIQLPALSGGGGGCGVAFPIHLPTGKKYTLSADIYGEIKIAYYNDDNVYTTYQSLISSPSSKTHKKVTFEIPSGAYWSVLIFQNNREVTYTYENVMLVDGESESEYEAFNGEFLTEDATHFYTYNGINYVWADAGILIIYENKVLSSLNTINNNIENLNVLTEKLNNNVINRNLDVLPVSQACVSYGINSAGVINAKKTIGILITTDVHKCAEAFQNAVDYLNEYDFLDIGFCLGDMAASNFAESDGTWYTDIVNSSNKPFYTVIGNHDGGNSKDASISGTVQQSFDKWIYPTRNKMGMPNLDKPYYAIHNSEYGISIIVLDTYDVPDTLDDSENFVVSRGANAYSQAQINWLISELGNVPADNPLILVQHTFDGTTARQTSVWSQKWGGILNESNYGNIIPDIINAWINKTTLKDTYTTTLAGLPELSVNADFSSRTKSIFVAHIVGHSHADYYSKSTKYADQNIICFVCTADDKYQGGMNDLPRVKGKKSQDAFTILSINKAHKTLNLARVGSNKTISMTDRTMFALDYTDN